MTRGGCRTKAGKHGVRGQMQRLRRRSWRRGAKRAMRAHATAALPRLRNADRKSLLLGTALASTLLVGALVTPTPAAAVACIQPASPNPIIDAEATFIT